MGTEGMICFCLGIFFLLLSHTVFAGRQTVSWDKNGLTITTANGSFTNWSWEQIEAIKATPLGVQPK